MHANNNDKNKHSNQIVTPSKNKDSIAEVTDPSFDTKMFSPLAENSYILHTSNQQEIKFEYFHSPPLSPQSYSPFNQTPPNHSHSQQEVQDLILNEQNMENKSSRNPLEKPHSSRNYRGRRPQEKRINQLETIHRSIHNYKGRRYQERNVNKSILNTIIQHYKKNYQNSKGKTNAQFSTYSAQANKILDKLSRELRTNSKEKSQENPILGMIIHFAIKKQIDNFRNNKFDPKISEKNKPIYLSRFQEVLKGFKITQISNNKRYQSGSTL